MGPRLDLSVFSRFVVLLGLGLSGNCRGLKDCRLRFTPLSRGLAQHVEGWSRDDATRRSRTDRRAYRFANERDLSARIRTCNHHDRRDHRVASHFSKCCSRQKIGPPVMPLSANCLRRHRYLANSARLGAPDCGRKIVPRQQVFGATLPCLPNEHSAKSLWGRAGRRSYLCSMDKAQDLGATLPTSRGDLNPCARTGMNPHDIDCCWAK